MAEILWADASITGGATNPANALGAFDGTWTGNTSSDSWNHRWGMGNPSGALSGTQTIVVRARKDASGGNGDPSFTISLWENGVEVRVLTGAITVPDAGVDAVATFADNELTDPNNAEIRIDVTAQGGQPAGRRTVQIDGIRWDAETAVVIPGGGSEATVNVSAEAGGVKGGLGSSDASIAVSAESGGGKLGSGGADAIVAVTQESGGRKVARDGAEVSVAITAEGAGEQVIPGIEGGSESTVSTDVEGAGRKLASGASEASVSIATEGEGETSEEDAGSGKYKQHPFFKGMVSVYTKPRVAPALGPGLGRRLTRGKGR